MKVSVQEKFKSQVQIAIEKLISANAASRVAAKDATLWGKDAESEAKIRLGWVDAWEETNKLLPAIKSLKQKLDANGVNRFVLCGMGGSSLAPEVLSIFKALPLEILDSTNSDQINEAFENGLDNLAVFVSSKSGTTVETTSQFKLFQERFLNHGIDPLERIIVITDPGSALDQEARKSGFTVFNADPNIGGRYSALSAFGVVPAALAGFDVEMMLQEAKDFSQNLKDDTEYNPAIILGAFLANTPNIALAPISDDTSAVPAWIEQLIAESTGKEGKGILPIALEDSAPELISRPNDIKVAGLQFSEVIDGTQANSKYDVIVTGPISEQFIVWEWATVLASYLIGINPFDQPDVESAKVAARAALAAGAASLPAPDLKNPSVADITDAVSKLLQNLQSTGYVSVQAYLNRKSLGELEELRPLFFNKTGRAVTFGWGPRFLHSTGQFHKGGPKHGVFLQITGGSSELAIPGGTTFNELIASQAAGDLKVLQEAGLSVLNIHFDNPNDALQILNAVKALPELNLSNSED